MHLGIRSLVLTLVFGMGFSVVGFGDEKLPPVAPTCVRVADDYFKDEVWAKVGAQSCLICHQ